MKPRALALAGCLALAWFAPLSAHHPLSDYNLDDPQTIEGTLVEVQLANPHSMLDVDVPDHAGGSQRWRIEWLPALQLKGQGITTGTLGIGDHVVVAGYLSRNPADHRIRLRTIRRPADGWKWAGGFD